MGGVEDDFGALNGGADGADRLFGHEFHANGGGQVKDGISAADEQRGGLLVFHGVADEVELGIGTEVRNVGFAAGGEVVEDGERVAILEEALGEVRADKACAAGEEVVHWGDYRLPTEQLLTGIGRAGGEEGFAAPFCNDGGAAFWRVACRGSRGDRRRRAT